MLSTENFVDNTLYLAGPQDSGVVKSVVAKVKCLLEKPLSAASLLYACKI